MSTEKQVVVDLDIKVCVR